MDLETTDASTQQKPEQMEWEFTITAYPNVQENLKLLTEDQVTLEEPASSSETLSSLQNLDKDLSFTDQFFVEKPQEEEPRKTYAEAESQSDSPLPTSSTTTSTITTTTLPPPPLQSTTDPILVRLIADIPEAQELSPTDYLMQDDSIPEEQVYLSDDEDSENDHQPKADSRKDWWKPLPEEERTATPEPAWSIPSSNKSDVVNNWASMLATTYEPPAENSLLAKIRDMTTFMNWYCQKVN
ncbi:hypothetical protein Tco_0869991 [Tanacetum coccineum]